MMPLDEQPVIGIWGAFKSIDPLQGPALIDESQLDVEFAISIHEAPAFREKKTQEDALIANRFFSRFKIPAGSFAVAKSKLETELKEAGISIDKLPESFIQDFFSAFLHYSKHTSDYFFKDTPYQNKQKTMSIELRRKADNPNQLDNLIWFAAAQALNEQKGEASKDVSSDELMCLLDGFCNFEAGFNGASLNYGVSGISDSKDPPSVIAQLAERLYEIESQDVSVHLRKKPTLITAPHDLADAFSFDRSIWELSADSAGDRYNRYELKRLALLDCLNKGEELDFAKIWALSSNRDFPRNTFKFKIQCEFDGAFYEEAIAWESSGMLHFKASQKSFNEKDLFDFLGRVKILCQKMAYSNEKTAEVIARILSSDQSGDHAEVIITHPVLQYYGCQFAQAGSLPLRHAREQIKEITFELQPNDRYSASMKQDILYTEIALPDGRILFSAPEEPPLARVGFSSTYNEGLFEGEAATIYFEVDPAFEPELRKAVQKAAVPGVSLKNELSPLKCEIRLKRSYEQVDGLKFANISSCELEVDTDPEDKIFLKKRAKLQTALIMSNFDFQSGLMPNGQSINPDFFTLPFIFHFQAGDKVLSFDNRSDNGSEGERLQAFYKFLKEMKLACDELQYPRARTARLLSAIMCADERSYHKKEILSNHLEEQFDDALYDLGGKRDTVIKSAKTKPIGMVVFDIKADAAACEVLATSEVDNDLQFLGGYNNNEEPLTRPLISKQVYRFNEGASQFLPVSIECTLDESLEEFLRAKQQAVLLAHSAQRDSGYGTLEHQAVAGSAGAGAVSAVPVSSPLVSSSVVEPPSVSMSAPSLFADSMRVEECDIQITRPSKQKTDIDILPDSELVQPFLGKDQTFSDKYSALNKALIKGLYASSFNLETFWLEQGRLLNPDFERMPMCFHFTDMSGKPVYFQTKKTKQGCFIKEDSQAAFEMVDEVKLNQAFVKFLQKANEACVAHGYSKIKQANLLSALMACDQGVAFKGQAIASTLVKRALPEKAQRAFKLGFKEAEKFVDVGLSLNATSYGITVKGQSLGVDITETDLERKTFSGETAVNTLAVFNEAESRFIPTSVTFNLGERVEEVLRQRAAPFQALKAYEEKTKALRNRASKQSIAMAVGLSVVGTLGVAALTFFTLYPAMTAAIATGILAVSIAGGPVTAAILAGIGLAAGLAFAIGIGAYFFAKNRSKKIEIQTNALRKAYEEAQVLPPDQETINEPLLTQSLRPTPTFQSIKLTLPAGTATKTLSFPNNVTGVIQSKSPDETQLMFPIQATRKVFEKSAQQADEELRDIDVRVLANQETTQLDQRVWLQALEAIQEMEGATREQTAALQRDLLGMKELLLNRALVYHEARVGGKGIRMSHHEGVALAGNDSKQETQIEIIRENADYVLKVTSSLRTSYLKGEVGSDKKLPSSPLFVAKSTFIKRAGQPLEIESATIVSDKNYDARLQAIVDASAQPKRGFGLFSQPTQAPVSRPASRTASAESKFASARRRSSSGPGSSDSPV